MASNVLLEDGPGLADPCERKCADLTANMTDQQKEDLSASAQKFVRYIAFK